MLVYSKVMLWPFVFFSWCGGGAGVCVHMCKECGCGSVYTGACVEVTSGLWLSLSMFCLSPTDLTDWPSYSRDLPVSITPVVTDIHDHDNLTFYIGAGHPSSGPLASIGLPSYGETTAFWELHPNYILLN